MKRFIKNVIVIGLICFLFLSSLLLFFGNYLYDYTLNPHASEDVFDVFHIQEDNHGKSYQWLKERSQDVYVQSDDHLKLHGYYIEQSGHTYMIMVHGYRSDGTSLVSPAKVMKKKGYHILIPDLRGHGLSEGNYIGMVWDDRKDIMKWISFLLERDQNANIILYGISMGGATVMNVSGEKLPCQVKAIIEDCGYSDVWEVFTKHFDMNDIEKTILYFTANLTTKMKAGYFLLEDSPIRQVRKSTTPLLFIHGDQDQIVPFSMMNQLYQVATCPKEKLVIHQAQHANCLSKNAQLYYQTIFDFIDRYT